MTTLTTPAISTWNLDPVHSVAEFKVKHMMISNVKGQFTSLSGTLTLDEADITNSVVKASIEIASINTRDAQRDGHLKSPDFFHADQFPTMALETTRVAHNADGDLVVAGNLTIKDVTRNVEFVVEGPSVPAKDPWGNIRIGLSATTKINRKDFGLSWNAALESGGILVGEDIIITLDLQFVKA
ncbi:YceI family protein [Acidicapsa acidisoli]|uniref:YceI family protein n=1 Tax=Acidicapsa acidisoli TaxID=1615681 RepID=UPI0021DFFD89|nr:YceI family protein [Acidicapsa acidisoli]